MLTSGVNVLTSAHMLTSARCQRAYICSWSRLVCSCPHWSAWVSGPFQTHSDHYGPVYNTADPCRPMLTRALNWQTTARSQPETSNPEPQSSNPELQTLACIPSRRNAHPSTLSSACPSSLFSSLELSDTKVYQP